MFGVVRPCRHRLRGPLFGQWMAHLCGLCLTVRDLHGQHARVVTNYDGLLVSVLTEAQNPAVTPHRTAGPCALRGLRRADVADAAGAGARLAASVSLVLAAGKLRDHVADGDGVFARRLVASPAETIAARWQAAGERTGARIGFDTAVLTDAISRQAEVERAAGLGLLDVTEPTETAVSAAFAHTAVLAGRPRNARQLAEAGRSFGRVAHLLDAVEDLHADQSAGAYNPLLATGTGPDRAREVCDEAVAGLRDAIAALALDERALAESLLAREVGVAVDQVFAGLTRGRARAGGLTAGLPCLQGITNRPGEPDFGPVPRRRGRCAGCCSDGRCGDCCSDCCCDGCCEACGDCADCGSCCDCGC
ncbi:MAG TPA: DUF5685 family protein [Streptosporangiaceae bacterium]|nr:DUF5685 family protein [Streptosporangiaceae bacterium]